MTGTGTARCPHTKDYRLKRGKEPRISLRVAGGSYCVVMCPECHRELKNGGSFIYEVMRKGTVVQYRVVKATEDTEDVFFEVRTNMLESV